MSSMTGRILLLLALVSICCAATNPGIAVKIPMAPPEWALLERELLRANSRAAEQFFAKYVDERGYLAHTPRWGTLDGPDSSFHLVPLRAPRGRERRLYPPLVLSAGG